jgi:AhpD family alkylhydroperoxidase
VTRFSLVIRLGSEDGTATKEAMCTDTRAKTVPFHEEEEAMTRQEVYREIEEMFGLVPSMFKAVPDSSLELEWKLFKQVQFAEGAIPNKYRELIGVAISAVTKCRYCSVFHTEVAKLNGATEAEIEDAVHFAKSSAGWSTYVNGLQMDYDQFRDEVLQACEHVRSAQVKRG